MKYGLNLLLWTDRMHDGMVPVVERIKKLGYDGIEIPIFELDESLYKSWSTPSAWSGRPSRSAAPATIRSARRRASARPPSMP
jgi:sugar phosphate isomerase/epimerase